MAGFTKEDFDNIVRVGKELGSDYGHIQENAEKMTSSMKDYLTAIEKIAIVQKNISHQTKIQLEYEEKIKKNEAEIIKLQNSTAQQDKNRVEQLWKENIAAENTLNIIKEEIDALKKTNTELNKSIESVNKYRLAWTTTKNVIGGIPNLIKLGNDKLKAWGLEDMTKAIKKSELGMGILKSQSHGFYTTIENASKTTQQLGFGIKDIAESQAAYSESIGRAVQLSDEGVIAIAQMAQGTTLGAEGAGQMAADMNSFNVSAVSAKNIVDETVNSAHKMGVNASKVIKNLQNGLKMANKYHFKEGIKGVTEMAAVAARFKMDMGDLSGMADKLFDIEGAVEMSSQLQVMGGEWSKLADPFKLMYQVRNDFGGLQKSVIEATSHMADFNKETGEISFSGLELHRMREISKITGIDADKIAEMAKQQRIFNEAASEIKFPVDKETKTFIESMAQFDQKTHQFTIKLSGHKKMIPIKELEKFSGDLKKTMADKSSLEERAKQARTFNDRWEDTVNMLKNALLPFMESLNNTLAPMFNDFQKHIVAKDGLVSRIKEFGVSAADLIGKLAKGALWLGKIMTDNPIITAITLLAGDMAIWFARGVTLGKGFMMASGGGTGVVGTSSSFGTTKGAGFGSNLKSAGASNWLKAGGVIAGLTSAIFEFNDNQKKGMGTGENIGRSGAKGTGAGLGAWGGASLGAAIGTAVFPGVGTAIGALLGGAIGAGVGGFAGKNTGDLIWGDKADDAVISGGKITPINTKDKVYEVSKPGGAFSQARQDGNIEIEFKNSLKIDFGDITINSTDSSIKIDLTNDTKFVRELSKKIQMELRTAIGGGVLNPNPIG